MRRRVAEVTLRCRMVSSDWRHSEDAVVVIALRLPAASDGFSYHRPQATAAGGLPVRWSWIVWVVCWFTIATAAAGEPMTTRLIPDVRVYPQFYGVAQDHRRQLYLGGTDGIVRHDGGRWIWQPAPTRGAVRTLYVDAGGRVWYGGTDSFGYLQELPTGEQRFVDVSAQFADELHGRHFADVWTIAGHGGLVWFQALHDLFAVDAKGRRVGHWYRAERFGMVVPVHGQLWVQWRGEGIRRWTGRDFVPVAGTAAYAGKPIYGIYELADGGLLVHDIAIGLSIWRQGALTPIADPGLHGAISHIYWGVGLGGGRFAFAGDDGFMRVFDLARRRFDAYPVGNGFMSTIVRDRDGDLLVVDDHGIVRIPWPLRWTRYASDEGIAGTLHGLAGLGDRLILCGSAGAQRIDMRDGEPQFPARPLAWMQGECWQVLRQGGELLVAESMALLRIDGDKVTRLSRDDLYPRALLPDPADPSLLWVGTENGPALFRRHGSDWTEVGRIEAAGWLIATLAPAPSGVWMGSDNRGLYLAQVDATAKAGFRAQRWGRGRGVETGASQEAEVFAWPEGTFVSTERGFFRFQHDRFVRDTLDGLQALRAEREVVNLATIAGDDRWAYSFHTIFRKPAGGRWQVVLVGDPMLGPIAALLTLPGGDALVGAAGQVLRFQPGKADPHPAEAPQVRVTALRLTAGRDAPKRLPLDQVPRVRSGSELDFDLGLSDYGTGDKQYQVRLQGLADTWSDWSRQASYRYFALPPGEYALQMRARRGYGEPVAGAPFRFVVEPRWYERRGVVPMLIVAACAVVVGALVQRQRLRVRRLREHNRELDRLVHARTQDLEHANQRLQDLADRDGLTGIANRRRFDAFLEQSVARARARGLPLGLAMIDVDHFKRYNDSHGHQAGDDVLRGVARVLADSVRGDTLVARYGGEEFAIVVPGCGLAGMRELAERLRARIEATLGSVTASIGICAADATTTLAPAELLARADGLLYRAKEAGRNRVEG